MKFLDGSAVTAEIRKLVVSSKTLRIAVAYWGAKAMTETGLSNVPTDKDIIIACDLMSGACNVSEIKELRGRFSKKAVTKVDKLHGKVWLTEKAAIIDSSNASANGLGFEGKEASGLI